MNVARTMETVLRSLARQRTLLHGGLGKRKYEIEGAIGDLRNAEWKLQAFSESTQ